MGIVAVGIGGSSTFLRFLVTFDTSIFGAGICTAGSSNFIAGRLGIVTSAVRAAQATAAPETAPRTKAGSGEPPDGAASTSACSDSTLAFNAASAARSAAAS